MVDGSHEKSGNFVNMSWESGNNCLELCLGEYDSHVANIAAW